MSRFPRLRRLLNPIVSTLILTIFAGSFARAETVASTAASIIASPAPALEITRPIRPWEFLSATGQRAGLLGGENGNVEAWVYPLKILRNFHLRFHFQGQVIEASTLARTLVTRPESTTIVYAANSFQVRETFFVPVEEPGAIISLEVQATQPVEIEAVFDRDLELMWPAGLGAAYISWNGDLHRFELGEEQKKYVGLIGSPSARAGEQEYFSNSGSSAESSFFLGVCNPGRDRKLIAIAGSVTGLKDAQQTYQRLVTDSTGLMRTSAAYYQDYLNRTVGLDLPDTQLQQAYDWSRVSMIQGMVNNPFLGKGLVAGYRTSAADGRPGFAWFFGRDSLWTDLALHSEGDFSDAKTAIEFLLQFQRADGKVEHEVSQSASLVPWFKDYPYAFASADATPLLIITMNDYVTQSGDVAFAKTKWDNLWRAYQFLQSTRDPQGFPQNQGVGHGWIEGGPLLPVKSELYQSALGAEALRGLARLASLTGHTDVSQSLAHEFDERKQQLNHAFWSPEHNFFGYALDPQGKLVATSSILSTVPMWLGLLDEDKADSTITELAGPGHQADWGTRIISSLHPDYEPSGYHFGSVWPLFTGWAAVGEYRYHRALPAYLNLRANALLALDGSAGHVTEVLSGDYYQTLATASPHQIWSAAMVVSPLLRGMLGMEVDATKSELRLTPHLPADWDAVGIRNVPVSSALLTLQLHRTANSMDLAVTRSGQGKGAIAIEFAPAISLRGTVIGVQADGVKVPFDVVQSLEDQHVHMRVALKPGKNLLHIDLAHDFAVGLRNTLPPLGSSSQGLRLVSEAWSPSRDTLTVEVFGIAGQDYDLPLWNPAEVNSVQGAVMVVDGSGKTVARVHFPAGDTASFTPQRIIFRMVGAH